MYQVTRLPNGLTVATGRMPHMASASLGIWMGVGARHEPAELSGASHFIEHLLFKGTKHRTAKQISQDVEGVGGYLNAFTSEENTCYYSKAHHDKFDELLDVLMDMFLESRFARAEIHKERNVIKEELAMYMDQPSQYVHELLNETLWPNQPLGRAITGTEKTLDAMGRPQLTGYMRDKYVAASALLVAAGNVEHAAVVRAVRRYASRFNQGARPSFQPVVVRQNQPRVRLHTKATEQTQLAIGIRTCSRHDGRRHALRVLNTLLGENMSSRLFQVLREDLGLAYSIYSSNSFFEDAGTMTIAAGVDTEKIPRMLKIIVRELRRFRETTPTGAEMRRARDYLTGQFDLGLEGTENQMMWLGEQLLGYGLIKQPAEVKAAIAKVRPAEVRAAARDFFQPDHISLALVSPLKSPKGLLELLAG
jgi:predicted Zn-dependent peptidase